MVWKLLSALVRRGPAKTDNDVAPGRTEAEAAVPLDLNALDGAFQVVDALPHPHWQTIRNWIHREIAEPQRHAAWTVAARQWLQTLAAALPPGYQIEQSTHFLMLSTESPDNARKLVVFCERTRARLRKALEGAVPEEGLGPHVLILPADQDTYYNYLSYFYPPGNHPRTGGLFIHGDGYLHIVIAPTPQNHGREETIAHEMTHNLLYRLRLPLWLEEGLAEVLPLVVLQRPHAGLPRELAEKHHRYWHRHGMDEFWSGATFQKDNRGFELSYSLASTLVWNIASDHPKRFRQFIAKAKRDDAGEAAAREVLGCSLGDFAGQFLGPGQWAPTSKG